MGRDSGFIFDMAENKNQRINLYIQRIFKRMEKKENYKSKKMGEM